MNRIAELFGKQTKIDGSCLIWTGYCDKDGYGRFRVHGAGIDSKAHRFAYFLEHGDVPPLLRHTCDNPPCVRVEHLIPGTHQDNTDDMIERGRHKPAKRKFSAEEEEIICQKYVDGYTYRELADEYNTSFGNIQYIIRRGNVKPRNRGKRR